MGRHEADARSIPPRSRHGTRPSHKDQHRRADQGEDHADTVDDAIDNHLVAIISPAAPLNSFMPPHQLIVPSVIGRAIVAPHRKGATNATAAAGKSS